MKFYMSHLTGINVGAYQDLIKSLFVSASQSQLVEQKEF